MEHTYSIVEEKENKLDSVIEKTNLTAKFTMRNVLAHRNKLRKDIEEIQGQRSVELATAGMIEMDAKYAFLKDVTESQYDAAYRYFLAKTRIPNLDKKQKECEDTLAEYEKEIPLIAKGVGFNEEELQENTASTPRPEGQ